MAKFHFRAGDAFEILTPEEHKAEIDRVVDMLSRSQRPPNSMDRSSEKTTDTAGAISRHVLFRVPLGMVAVMHRINVEATGYTRAAPLTAGYLSFALDSADFSHNFAGLPETPSAGSAPVLPYTIDNSVSAAKIAKQGQEFIVYGASLPVSTQLFFNCQVLLWETEG